MPVDFQPIDFQPSQGSGVDFQPSSQQPQVHPSKMSDHDIATKLLGMSDQDAQWMMRHPDYRPGMLAAGFSAPDDVMGRNNLGGTWIGSGAAGLRKGYNGAAQLLQTLAAKIPGAGTDNQGRTAGTLLYGALGKINELNQNLNQGRTINQGGLDPANILGQGLAAESLTGPLIPAPSIATATTRLGTSAAKGAAGAFVVGEGDIDSRIKQAMLGAGIGMGTQKGLDAGRWLLGKAKVLGKTPSVREMMDWLSAKYGGKKSGQAAQDALEEGYGRGWSEYRDVVRPVDAEAPAVNVRLNSTLDTTDDILNRAKTTFSGGEIPEGLPYFEDINRRAANSLSDSPSITSTFDDVAAKASKVGGKLREMRKSFGERLDKAPYEAVQNALIEDMNRSAPDLGVRAADARRVFAERVVPYFDQDATALRTTGNPNDWLTQHLPGQLTRAEADVLGRVAKLGSGDPILYQILENALQKADGRPGGYTQFMRNAMPVVDAVAPHSSIPGISANISDSIGTAQASRGLGALANVGGSYLIDQAVPGAAGHVVAGTLGTTAAFNPKFTGPGLTWKALQNPNVRRLLVMAGKMAPDESVTDFLARVTGAGVGANQGVSNNTGSYPADYSQQ